MADESFDWKLDGDGFGQGTAETCWYASYAIVHTWKKKPISVIKEKIVKAGLDFDDYYSKGLPIDDFWKTCAALGMVGWRGGFVLELANDLPAFAQLLKSYGPLWCGFNNPGKHIVVVTGVDLKNKQIHILNPWNRQNGLNADSQYATQENFINRLNTSSRCVLQTFM